MMVRYCIDTLLRSVFLVVLFISSKSAYGEMKVAERSAPKAPEWVMRHPEGYLVALASAPTIQEAQSRIEQELLRKVVSAVAVNVEGETFADSGVEEGKEWDNFYSRFSVRAAQLPFLSGISLARCKDTYWVRFSDKSSSKESYDFYVLFPFDSAERQKLIGEYEAYDSGMSDALSRLEEGWKDIVGYEGLVGAEGELESMVSWFPDMQRRKRAEKTLELYRGIRTSLALTVESEAKGKCRVRVMRGDRTFSIPGRLHVASDCASKISVLPDGDGWIVTYNTDDCLEDEDNTLKISLVGAGIGLKVTAEF